MPPTRRRILQIPWRTRTSIARDIDAELSFHLEMRVGELVARGLTVDEARRRAREEFGDLEFTRAYCRDVDQHANRATRLADRVAEWRQDLRYAVRTLRRSPGFAAVSLLTLAIAIGANTAIFSVARAVLLAPLPYGAPGSLVALFESWPGQPGDRTPMSPPNFADYRALQRTFTDVAAHGSSNAVTWRLENADPEMVSGVYVTTNLFHVLQARPLYGRVFASSDDATLRQAIVSYGFWQRALGGDSTSIGRRITLNGRDHEVIGVMPRRFTLGRGEDLWMPADMASELADAARTRKQRWMRVVGRLRPGTTIEAARTDLAAIARRLERQYPDANTGRTALVASLHDVVVGDLRTPLLLLQAAAVIVLLIACANLANLTLSRTIGRRRELALRAALGAGRGRLVRQLLTESVLLALVGGVLGTTLAVVSTRTLLSLNPDAIPDIFAAGVDGRALLFSIGLSVATGALFGLVPALDAARANLHDVLKEGGRGASGGRGGERIRRALVVAQVSLAVMLLVGAGLLMRSFGELTRVRLGFDPDHVLTAQVRADGARYDSSGAVNRFFDAVLADLARAPGIVAVGASNNVPTRGRIYSTLRVQGEAVDETRLPDIGYIATRGDYFKALRVPLLAGREYDVTDRPDGPKTVIINEVTARRFFPRGDAIGRQIRIGPNPNGPAMTIIGIVADIRDEGFGVPAKPTLFANHRQEAWERSLNIVIRTSGDPLAAAALVRRAVKENDPTLALREIQSLDDVVASSLAPRRFALALASCFAAVALLLAAIGIYGVLAYTVTTRTREFGVRIALGATVGSVVRLVLRQGMAWSLVGLALGLLGALAGRQLLAGMLFGVTAVDGTTYVAVAVGLLVIVGVACIVPAHRATRVDPLTSMRAE